MRLESTGLTKEQVKEKVATYMIDTYERIRAKVKFFMRGITFR